MISLEKMMELTIHEVSMVGPDKLNVVNVRCASNPKIAADITTPIWHKFKHHELTQVMRQKDAEFAKILNKVWLGKPQANTYVDKKLKEHELRLKEDDPNYPINALHVYAENVHAYARNEEVLKNIPEKQYIISAVDKTTNKNINIDKLTLPDVISQTGNMHSKLVVKVGARVFLTFNVSVEDGLTNGAYGTIQYIHEEMDPKDGNEKVSYILVHFDNDIVGVEVKRSPFKKMYPDAVTITKIEVPFQFISGKKTVFISRCNFPLSLG